MSIHISAARLQLELFVRGYYKGMTSVADLGAQDLTIPRSEIANLFSAAGIEYKSEEFPAAGGYTATRMSTEPFYKAMGFTRYQCFDIAANPSGAARSLSEAMDSSYMRWNAAFQDLNFPLNDPAFEGAFDLVTDYGNNEHAFNVTEAYRTQHRLCRAGGIIIIEQPVFGTNGYYNFTPAYFESMAQANRYDKIMITNTINDYLAPVENGEIEEFIPRSSSSLSYIFRKTRDADFVVPKDLSTTSSPSSKANEISVLRLPDVRARNYLVKHSESDHAAIGGRAALRIVAERLKNPFARN